MRTQGYVEQNGHSITKVAGSGGLAYTMDGKKEIIICDGTTGAVTVSAPDAEQFKKCQFLIVHQKGTNYTVVKSGDTTLKTFGAVGHCHLVYDNKTEDWIAI